MSEMATGSVVGTGLYIQLVFEPDRQVRRFLKDIPGRLGESFDEPDMHTSILYPEELVAAGLGSHEIARLPEASRSIMVGLGNIGIAGSTLEIAPNVLRPFKKFYGIEIIDDEDKCDEIRSIGTSVIKSVLGIQLRDYLPNYHAAVARRHRGDGRRKPVSYDRHFPNSLTIHGFNVGVRTVTTTKQCVNYINRLRHDPNRDFS